MSFILDALKKSENERQRHVGPSLADVQVRRRQNDRPWWVVAVAGLLVINLGVLLVVLTRREEPVSSSESAVQDRAPASTPAPTAPVTPSSAGRGTAPANVFPSASLAASSPASAAASATASATNPAVQSLADAADMSDDASVDPLLNSDLGAAAASVPEGPPMVQPIAPPQVAPAPQRMAANEVLPTHSDITASGTSLPEMHLDIHVYSENPAERFVFVNMRKYVEGQSLSEGPQLERVTPDGAVLNHRGLRFLLPRQ